MRRDALDNDEVKGDDDDYEDMIRRAREIIEKSSAESDLKELDEMTTGITRELKPMMMNNPEMIEKIMKLMYRERKRIRDADDEETGSDAKKPRHD